MSNLEERITSLEVALSKLVVRVEQLESTLIAKKKIESEKITCLDLTEDSTRELLTVDRLKAILDVKGLDPSNATAIQEIHLGSKSFDVTSAKYIASFFKNSSPIVSDLSDIIAGRKEEVALDVLEILCDTFLTDKTITLDLSDNALGEKGIRKLESSLKRLHSLKSVKFHNNGLSALSIDLLAGYMPLKKLETILFHNNMSGDGGAKAFSSMLKKTTVKHVQMSSCRVKQEGARALVESLDALKETLVSVNFSDAVFIGSGVTLVQTLAQCSHLEKLNLKDTDIGQNALQDLVSNILSNLEVCPILKSINLSCLEMGEDKDLCARFGKALAKRIQIETVELEENELENEGTTAFISSFGQNLDQKHSLTYLNLQTNLVSGIGGVTLATCVKDKQRFLVDLKINLDDNMFSLNNLNRIQDMLGEHLLGMEENDSEGDEDSDVDELVQGFKNDFNI